MKKQFFFGMVAAAALCGCSNNEVEQFQANEQNAIQFGTYVGQSTNGRAAVIDIDGMKDGTNGVTNGSQIVAKGFGVFGYYTGQTAWSASAKPNFMYNEEIQWKASASASPAAWEYSPVKYWPNNTDDQVSFFAYAPYDAGTAGNFNFTAVTSMTAPTFTFTVNPTVKSQQDLLWANVKNAKKPTVGAPAKGSNNVWFTFAHALARVGFTVEAMVDKVTSDKTGEANDDDATTSDAIANGTTISVDKVELIGKFYKSGKINLLDGSFSNWNTIANATVNAVPESDSDVSYVTGNQIDNTALATAEQLQGYGFKLESDNFKDVASNVTTTKSDLNKTDSYIMLIPQNFSSDKIQIRVTYKVTTNDNNLGESKSEITNVITSTPFTFDFAAGMAYTFNLHLGLTSVKFDANVTGWVDGDQPNTVVNVPINTTGN